MKNVIRILLMTLVLVGLVGHVQDAEAQFVKRLKERAKSRVEQNIGQKTDKTIDKAFDGGGQATADQEGEAPADAATNNATGAGASISSEEAAASGRPGEGAWANYDFVPGEHSLFIDDFTQDNVGDFPRRLEFVEGNMEVVEWQGRRFLRATSYPAAFNVVLPEALPERFTLEFDFAPMASGWGQYVTFAGSEVHDPASVECGYWRAGLNKNSSGGGESRVSFTTETTFDGQVFTCRVMADGPYVKVYQNERRVANVPNAALGRSSEIHFQLAASEEDPVLIGPIRIMAGGKDLYDALSAEGRVATQGILFDTGSDVIRPESTPTLKEIGQMLAEHPELRLRVEGHTDDVGSDEANQALSQRRAESVKAFLATSYGVDTARLEAQGLGPSKPMADNATPEGRQQNRRVELVKL